MRGIDIRALSMRRQLNLVQTWLENRYGEEQVRGLLEEPPPPLDRREPPKRSKRPPGRRMTREQAEQMARDAEAYDAEVVRG